MRVVIATRNQDKLREIRALLASSAIQVTGLDEVPGIPEVLEDGSTFLENAQKKARAVAEAASAPALADDSGLEVDALDGRPGVLSARYAGPECSHDKNNRKLLAELKGVPPARRSAAFVCAMVLAVPGNGESRTEGRLQGRILEAPRGTGGFGYDPLFLVEAAGQTLAEMGTESKNRVSHRGSALRRILPELLALAGREHLRE